MNFLPVTNNFTSLMNIKQAVTQGNNIVLAFYIFKSGVQPSLYLQHFSVL